MKNITNTKSPAVKDLRQADSQRGRVSPAARRVMGVHGEPPAASVISSQPVGNASGPLPVVVNGKLVLPDEAKAREQRQVKKLLRSIRMTEARALLIKVADSTIEFQRRVNLVRAFDVCREMGLSGSDFCRRLRITESTMRDWSARAKAQGFDSLRPWKGRAMTDSERAIIEGK